MFVEWDLIGLYLTKFVNKIPITIICDTQRAIVLDQLSYLGGPT